jgi:type I restriction enzyme, S subunit
MATGNAQPLVSLDNIKKIPVPFFPNINNLLNQHVIQAKTCWYDSETLYGKAEQLLLSELGLQDWKPSHRSAYVKNYSHSVRARRMDAEYFQPKFDEAIRHISAHCPQRLSKLATQVIEAVKFDERLKYRYIEISDVNTSTGEIGYTERWLKDLPPNAKIKVKGGELIVSKVRPTRGAIGVIPDDCRDNGVCSSAFIVLRVPSPVREFLQVYLRSNVGRIFLEQSCKGTSYPTIDDTDVKALPIPTISTQLQGRICELVSQSRHARREAKAILEKAKHAVEIAIEQGEDKAMEAMRRVSVVAKMPLSPASL